MLTWQGRFSRCSKSNVPRPRSRMCRQSVRETASVRPVPRPATTARRQSRARRMKRRSKLQTTELVECSKFLRYTFVYCIPARRGGMAFVFLPRDAQCKSSVRLSVRDVDVPWAYVLGSSKVITRIISSGSSLLGATTSEISSKGTPPKFVGIGLGSLFSAEKLQYL